MSEMPKNCPFCNGSEIEEQHNDSGYWFTCENNDCAFNAVLKSRAKALTLWNTRTDLCPSESDMGRVREALEWYANPEKYTVKNVTFATTEAGQSQSIQTAVEFDKGARARKALQLLPKAECEHSWEHLHGTDLKNEYRCSKCGNRK